MSTLSSFCMKLKKDKGYRQKFIRTLSIIFSYTTLGFFFSNLGPALPDIQLLIDQNLTVTSWLVTATCIGSLIGTVIGGPLCDRIGPQLVLFVSAFAGSCLTGIFIYCPTLITMLIVRVPTGIFIGGVDIGGIASVTAIWKAEARPYMQALQFMLSVGGIITPFIIRPFLANRSESVIPDSENNTMVGNNSIASVIYTFRNEKQAEDKNISNVLRTCFDILGRPGFDNDTFDKAPCDNISIVSFTTGKRPEGYIAAGETKIQYAFVLLAAIGVVASLTVLVFLITDCRNRGNTRSPVVRNDLKNINHRKFNISVKLTRVLLILMAFQCYFMAAMSTKVHALLPSFFVLQFSWSTAKASIAASCFWIGITVFRLAGVFLSLRFKQSVLFLCFCLIYITSAAGLIVAGLFQINSLAWISTVTLGAGVSILFPISITFTEENIAHVSGGVTSLYLVFFFGGGILDPLYTGFLMEEVSPMCFTYLVFSESLVFLFLFIAVKILLCFKGERRLSTLELEIEPMNGKTIKETTG